MKRSEQNQVHPIAEEAIACFPSGVGPHSQPDKKKLAQLERSFQKLIHTSELMSAVTTMIRLCELLQKHGATGAARSFYRIVALAIPRLESLTGAGAHDLARTARARFNQFLGQSQPALKTKGAPAGVSLLALRAQPARAK